MISIYVIAEAGDGGPCKIGYSVWPSGRLSSLQTGNPRKLRIVQRWAMADREAVDVERRIHDALTGVGGHIVGEWFAVTPEGACAAVDRVLAG